jgi:hypothetical protein
MTQLPAGLGSLDWSDWIKGIIAAFISGGAGAVTSGVVVSVGNPQQYNMGTQKFYVLVGSVFLMSGVLNMMAFLRTKSIPDVKQRETTVESMGGQVKTTIKETEMVPTAPTEALK